MTVLGLHHVTTTGPKIERARHPLSAPDWPELEAI
jgi:hypothetical protein